ncbi:polar amino acid transport system substrate-binding protein [Chitinivorax tropicus]|uniref:Polar amino acid transport system substrate-binding protein n=1 Tax=Chitinivorax tropicus TaxID=714531 RepID=A0A840MI73_9PROT|nr:transporter substrate-binding domain-containing protein [Chitinivorax tropicus]MBB5016889.1 polar amino acid transport system substrate-binding protein [Chitinivorax tropicus]
MWQFHSKAWAVAGLMWSVGVSAMEPINLVYVDVDSTPFLVGKGDMIATPPGLAVELVRDAITQAGYQVQIRRLPQLRMLKMLEEGKIDGAFIFSYTQDRAKKFAYPMKDGQPDGRYRVTHISYRLYRLKDSKVMWDGNQFSNLTLPVGVNTGWTMAAQLREKNIAVDEGGRGYPENFSKLKLKRLDAYAALELSADSYLKKMGQTELFEKVGPPLQSKDYFLLFSQQFAAAQPEAAQKIWQSVADMREKQESQLYSKYENVEPQ